MISFSDLLFIDRLRIILAILLGFSCVVFAGWQFRGSVFPIAEADRLKRSVSIGVAMSVFILSVFSIADILDQAFSWSIGRILVVFLCSVLPFQVLISVAAYIRYGRVMKFRQKIIDKMDELSKRES
jgi:hypothetical protein